MSTPEEANARLTTSKYEIKGRLFALDLLTFVNGCFASISEDQNRKLGAITVSVKLTERATSSSLIPESKGSIFAGMLGEMLAEKTHGMAVISLFIKQDLDIDIMKTLINEVRKILDKD